MKKNKFENKEKLEDELRDRIVLLIKDSIAKNESTSLLFSGGSTPSGLFKKLAKVELDWSSVKIGLVDDRMVEEKSEFSNANMIQDLFISKIKTSKPQFFPLVFDHENEKNNSKKLNEIIDEIGVPDITILGMGGDGHFASLFPRNKKSERGLLLNNRNAFCYTTAPSEPRERISFTWSFLRKSTNLFLFITGESKLSLIDSIYKREELPIDTLLIDDEIKPELYWAP
ncbi:6-phosphogluconolactonase [Flavobacteriales bacterium]|nr:6-phosphogluconolactonase [Flavobacteriales bacterium]